MLGGNLALVLAACAAWGVVALARVYWDRYARRPVAEETLPDFGTWILRGLATPVLLIALWNLLVLGGALSGVAPIAPGLTVRAQAPPTAAAAWMFGLGTVTLGTASLWGTVSLAWLLPRIRAGELDRGELKVLLGLYAVIFLLPAGALLWWIGPWATGFAGLLAVWPLVHFGSPERPPAAPTYGRAIGRMKFGKYADAEAEVLAQLEACETDFQGWMLLAQLYAEHFRELGEADATIWDLTSQPGLTPYELSQAFTRLADWHLNLGQDPHAARRALGEIVSRCAGTPFAVTAGHRLAQLPRDRAELKDRQAPRTLALPALSATARVAGDRPTPARDRAARLRERIAESPDDPGPREQLAVLRVRELGEVADGIRDLEALLRDPASPADRHPVWLAHLAEWHLAHRKDIPTARRHLERIVREHADTPHAVAASGRLWALEQEELDARSVPPSRSEPPRIVVRLPGPAPTD